MDGCDVVCARRSPASMMAPAESPIALAALMARLAFVPIPTAGGPGGGGSGAGGNGARICEACSGAHAGTYASGRFCSAPCAKKVGARRKWAAAPKARRAKRERAPCEACRKIHDRTYASGRFCSVHCARRVAAARKWDKNRSERSRRLDAIRPAAQPTLPQPQPVVLAVAPTPPPAPRCSCPCGAPLGVVYPGQGAPQQIFYANPVPWTVLPHPFAHPLALVPLHGPPMVQGAEQPRMPAVQLARTPVTPPSPPQRPRSPLVSGSRVAQALQTPQMQVETQTQGRTEMQMQQTQEKQSDMQQVPQVLQQQPRPQHTPEGAASEALLCLGVGDPSRSFATLPRSVTVPADD